MHFCISNHCSSSRKCFGLSFAAAIFLIQLISFVDRTSDATAGNNRSSFPTDWHTHEGLEASPIGGSQRRCRPEIQSHSQPLFCRCGPHRILPPLSYDGCICRRHLSSEFIPVHRLLFLDSTDAAPLIHIRKDERDIGKHSTATLFRMAAHCSSRWGFQSI